MENLKNNRFRAADWARPSVIVEGALTVRDYKTLEPADIKSNSNGYVICIENEDGFYIVSQDTVELLGNNYRLVERRLDPVVFKELYDNYYGTNNDCTPKPDNVVAFIKFNEELTPIFSN